MLLRDNFSLENPRDLLLQDKFGIHGLMLTFNLLDSDNIIKGKR